MLCYHFFTVSIVNAQNSTAPIVNTQNLRISIYVDAADVNRYLTTPEDREKVAVILQGLKISKIFLEGRREDDYVPPTVLREIRDDFLKRGFSVSGGVMFAAGKTWAVRTSVPGGLPWLNYEAEKTQRDLAQYFTENAAIFDEIIIDDMFATNDTSPESNRARGNRPWGEYRRDLLVSLIEPFMLKPARAVRPSVRLIIKYPQWYETFREMGYDPPRMSALFDETWAGTETRDPRSVQPTEGYINYGWLASVAGKKMNGGWFDWGGCTPQNFVDQAYQTVLAGAPEFALWHLGELMQDNPCTTRLQTALPELFELAGKVHGRPLRGISYYMPAGSNGQGNFYLADDLPMIGLPIVPESSYPTASRIAILPAHAAADPEILSHMKQHLSQGATLVLTPAFLNRLGKPAAEMAGVAVPGRQQRGTAGKIELKGKQVNLTTPLEIDLGLESPADAVLIWALAGDRRVPFLTSRVTGGGRILVLNVMVTSRGGDNGLPGIPQVLADELRGELLAPLGIQLSSPTKVSFYLWGDSSVFYNFRDEPVELKLNRKPISLGAHRVLFVQSDAPAANANIPFEGQKTIWHGFDRYDYMMDDATGAITPASPGAAGRRCIVVVPKEPAPGNPWSWRGCYWDHEPQTEVELLKRGFHIAYITANASLKPDQKWDAWYAFLTEKHGLSKKPAFIGMSRGGEYSYMWATTHPGQVSCIYGDNPGGNSENLARLEALAKQDVPLLHVCGSIDPILEKYSTATETFYHQFGGRISVMIKEGAGHHPHSLRDPKPIADFIEQSVRAAAVPAVPPAFAGKNFSRSSYYSFASDYLSVPTEDNYLTCRGPLFSPCYDRYDVWMGFDVPVTVIAPKQAAPGKPWVLRADFVSQDATVDQALLAKGFHIVVGPTGYNADGPNRDQWDAVYKHMTAAGFSPKPVMEGVGGAAGEAYAWAILNADKVCCVYAENPVLRSHMSKTPLILDNLAALAKAGVPLLHVCGSQDPWLKDHTLAIEAQYKKLGGPITVMIQEGMGHLPNAPRDPKPVVAFIMEKAAAVPATATSPRGAPGPMPPPRSVEDFLAAAKTVADRTPPEGYTGQYVKMYYPGLSDEGQLRFAVTYTLWIPDHVKTLRGIIVHQHGAGMTASKEGSTAAYDLHWQALTKKWDCALLGPCYHVLNDGDWDAAGSIYWMDPRRGSEKTFLRALHDFAVKTGHAELATVPWTLWGHSAGGIWSDIMSTLHPERVVGVYCRSGSQPVFFDRPLQVPPTTVTPAACAIPMMLSCGIKEDWITDKLMRTFKQYRDQGATMGFAHDPRTEHECGDSRYFAIPYLDTCLTMRLPDKGSQDQTLKPMDQSQAWLASLKNPEVAVPAAEFKGDLKESVWLPNEAVAKAYMEYVKTGAVGDTTPPPAPFNATATAQGNQGVEVTWSAEADFESGLRQFIVLRDGQVLAKVPERPRGQFGRALFQGMTYHDTPSQPMPDMLFFDASVRPGEKHSYTVITVNSVGIESRPSQWQYTFEPHDYKQVLDNVADVALDSKNNLYALVRGDIPILVFDAQGKYLRGWGQGLIKGPHGLYIDAHDHVFCVDSANHVVLKFTTEGKLLMTLGTRGVASESGCVQGNFKTVKKGGGPFNVPTKVTTSRTGEIFVSDGYGNARVHRFSADGQWIKSWGEPGTGPGQFNLPHGIAVDDDNNVYVADRENDRIQIFDLDGNLKKIWNDIYRPSAICIHEGYVYVTELGHRMYVDNVLFEPNGKGP